MTILSRRNATLNTRNKKEISPAQWPMSMVKGRRIIEHNDSIERETL